MQREKSQEGLILSSSYKLQALGKGASIINLKGSQEALSIKRTQRLISKTSVFDRLHFLQLTHRSW